MPSISGQTICAQWQICPRFHRVDAVEVRKSVVRLGWKEKRWTIFRSS
jgi:hypothetical protein